MIKITKPLLQKALIAGFFSAFTIGVLTVLTYKSTFHSPVPVGDFYQTFPK